MPGKFSSLNVPHYPRQWKLVGDVVVTSMWLWVLYMCKERGPYVFVSACASVGPRPGVRGTGTSAWPDEPIDWRLVRPPSASRVTKPHQRRACATRSRTMPRLRTTSSTTRLSGGRRLPTTTLRPTRPPTDWTCAVPVPEWQTLHRLSAAAVQWGGGGCVHAHESEFGLLARGAVVPDARAFTRRPQPRPRACLRFGLAAAECTPALPTHGLRPVTSPVSPPPNPA